MSCVSLLEAERDLLAGILLDAADLDSVTRIVSPADFSSVAHAKTFSAMAAIHRAGRLIDLASVIDVLAKRGDLDGVGGAAFVGMLDATIPVVAKLAWYAAQVADAALLRRLVAAGEKIAALGRAWHEDGGALVEVAEQLIKDARSSRVEGEVVHV